VTQEPACTALKAIDPAGGDGSPQFACGANGDRITHVAVAAGARIVGDLYQASSGKQADNNCADLCRPGSIPILSPGAGNPAPFAVPAFWQ